MVVISDMRDLVRTIDGLNSVGDHAMLISTASIITEFISTQSATAGVLRLGRALSACRLADLGVRQKGGSLAGVGHAQGVAEAQCRSCA